MDADQVRRINQAGWDARVAEGDVWTGPVGPEVIAKARRGDGSVVLTPNRPVPRDWFGDIEDRDVLCLASGGGQLKAAFQLTDLYEDTDLGPSPTGRSRFFPTCLATWAVKP